MTARAPRSPATQRSGRWQVQGHPTVGFGVGAAILAVGVILGRPDIVVVAAVPLLATAAAWWRTPEAHGDVSVTVAAAGQLDGSAPSARVRFTGSAGGSLHLRSHAPQMRPAERILALPPSDDEHATVSRQVVVRAPIVRTGAHRLFALDVRGLTADATHSTEVFSAGASPVLVLPSVQPLPAAPLPHRLDGLTGTHPSRRIGDGGDFHDIHEFSAGDRLRRIDWRTTARRAAAGRMDLYVRRTYATADATVVIAVDSRDDIGGDPSTWAGGGRVSLAEVTSLDLAREAAASLAHRYLTAGDRVGVEDLAGRQRALAPAGGRRHLDRVVRRLATTEPRTWSSVRVRAPQIPSGALAVVVSTFLDDESAVVAQQWRAQGHRVIAVDVLPPIRRGRMNERMRTAHRMIEMERRDRMTELRRRGIDVVAWEPRAGNGTRAAIQTLARRRTRAGNARRSLR